MKKIFTPNALKVLDEKTQHIKEQKLYRYQRWSCKDSHHKSVSQDAGLVHWPQVEKEQSQFGQAPAQDKSRSHWDLPAQLSRKPRQASGSGKISLVSQLILTLKLHRTNSIPIKQPVGIWEMFSCFRLGSCCIQEQILGCWC